VGACVGASVSGHSPHDLEQIILRATFGLWLVGYLYVFLHALLKTETGLSKRNSAHEFASCPSIFESTYSNVKASLSSHTSCFKDLKTIDSESESGKECPVCKQSKPHDVGQNLKIS